MIDLDADRSPAQKLASLDEDKRIAWIEARKANGELDQLIKSWSFWRRPSQATPEGDWRIWLICSGRGFGKSRCLAEWIVERCEAFAKVGAAHLVGLMGSRFASINAIIIPALGEVCRRKGYTLHHPPTALVGYIEIDGHRSDFEFLTAQDPDGPRGRNFHTIAADELAAWPQKMDAEGGTVWTNADLALRAPCPEGMRPQAVVATTPKPVQTLKDLLAGDHGKTHVTRGSLLQNIANLDESFVSAIIRRYAGTRLGAQEIDGMLLDDVEGALWTGTRLEASRYHDLESVPDLFSIAVAVDPAGGGADEVGIIVAGAGWVDDEVHLFVLDDLSGRMSVDDWPDVAVGAYRKWNADSIVAEVNFGGDMVRRVLQVVDASVPYHEVRATRGKAVRAEPVAALWSPLQERAHMVGMLPLLEEELTTWVPGLSKDSPGRLDALVWAGHHLLADLTMTDVMQGHGTSISAARM